MPRWTRRDLLGGGVVVAATAALSGTARASTARARSATTCGPALILPTRRGQAAGGVDLAHSLTDTPEHDRYRLLADAILAGNVPSWLRILTPVHIEAPPDRLLSSVRSSAGPHLATIFVTPDYLSVGPRQDAVRQPLDLNQAARLALALHMSLPTTRMVDAIYAAAQTIVAPNPLPPDAAMRSMPTILHHQRLVETARGGRPVAPLMAGHKKDLVLTRRLATHPDRIAIYGWHRPTGRPIQPLSLVHGRGYADYSHGVRLVWRTILIDGHPMDLFAPLEDPAIAPFLSTEGPITDARSLLRAC